MKEEKDKKLNYYSTVRFLSSFIKDNKIEYVLFYVGWLFHTLVSVIGPIVFGIMINQIVYYQNIKLFIKIGMVFLFVTIFGVVLYYLIYEMYAYLWNSVNRQLRLKLYSKLQRISMKDYSNLKYGETVNLIEFWSTECVNFLIRNVVHFFNNIILISLCYIVTFLINWKFGLVAVLMVPISITVSHRTGKKIRKNSDINKEDYSRYFSWLFEKIHALSDLRMLGAEDAVVKQLEDKQDEINDKNMQIAMDNQVSKEGLINVKNVILVLQYGLMGYFSIKCGMTIGVVMVLLSFFSIISTNMTQVVDCYMDSQNRISIIQKIKDFIDRPSYDDGIGTKKTLDEKINKIKISDCCFSYGDNEVLKDINLEVESGQVCAIVGDSGSGKSTLLNLLLGFYMPDKGNVLINDIDLREIDLESYYRHLGVVFQNVLLLKGNVRKNIVMEREKSEIEMIEAAKAAEIHNEIMTIENGYDSYVENGGSNFSGGQRQRIGIARAYARNADVIIMDEATSALDADNEEKIVEKWGQIFENKIGITVTHKLGVAMKCNRILMIRNGMIVASGTPQQMVNNADFRELFAIKEGE